MSKRITKKEARKIFTNTRQFLWQLLSLVVVYFLFDRFFCSTLALSLHVVSSARARMKEYGTWSQLIESNRNNHVCRYERINSSWLMCALCVPLKCFEPVHVHAWTNRHRQNRRFSIHSTIHTRTRTHGPHSPCAADALYISHIWLVSSSVNRIPCMRTLAFGYIAYGIFAGCLFAQTTSLSFFSMLLAHLFFILNPHTSYPTLLTSHRSIAYSLIICGMAWHCLHTTQACSSSILSLLLSRSLAHGQCFYLELCACVCCCCFRSCWWCFFIHWIYTNWIVDWSRLVARLFVFIYCAYISRSFCIMIF